MSLHIASLNSGSNGNSFYIGGANEAVLIDAGISCRETEARMKSLGLNPAKIRAVFITHEHADHISGIRVFLSKYRIPGYATPGTLKAMEKMSISGGINTLRRDEEFTVGEMSIIPFAKHHDAADPVSFIVTNKNSGVTAGVFTDIGSVCKDLIKYFSKCHAAFLEANYDETMLAEGKYPEYLKRRIAGDKGHLSNDQALRLFIKHRAPDLSHLILSHLSAENNCPDKIMNLFSEHAGGVRIEIASRYAHTPLFCISSRKASKNKPSSTPYPEQMKLF